MLRRVCHDNYRLGRGLGFGAPDLAVNDEVRAVTCWVEPAASGEQVTQGFAGFGRTHEGFANQEGVDVVVAHQFDVVGHQNATFCDDGFAFRDKGQQFKGGLQACFKGAQVAVVDADQRGLKLKGDVEFGAVVNFDQNVHAQFKGEVFEFAQLLQVKRSDDQQDAIGTQRPCVDDLIGIDHEIFAQHR